MPNHVPSIGIYRPDDRQVLTPEQESRLAKHEVLLSVGLSTFVDNGNALRDIRDDRLYRKTHRTFEQYVAEVWGLEDKHCHRLIASAEVFACLKQLRQCYGKESFPLPVNEIQCRHLAPLFPADRLEVWRQALAMAGGRQPTGPMVQKARADCEAEWSKMAEELDAKAAARSGDHPMMTYEEARKATDELKTIFDERRAHLASAKAHIISLGLGVAENRATLSHDEFNEWLGSLEEHVAEECLMAEGLARGCPHDPDPTQEAVNYFLENYGEEFIEIPVAFEEPIAA